MRVWQLSFILAVNDLVLKRNALVRKYKVIIFKSFAQLKAEKDSIVAELPGCDQLNVVVRDEGNMDDPEVLAIDPKIKLFAGAAWALIHDRRIKDGWYDSPQEI